VRIGRTTWPELEATGQCRPAGKRRLPGFLMFKEAGQARTAQKLAADKRVQAQRTLSEAMIGNQNAAKGKKKNRTSNGRAVSRGSNQVCYLVRRLKRDAPDIALALGRGEYKSARAAAIAAGIVKVDGSRKRNPPGAE
jgi:hypothetical protein